MDSKGAARFAAWTACKHDKTRAFCSTFPTPETCERGAWQLAWKNKLKLGRGHTLRLSGSGNTGNLGQRDAARYEVVDSTGQVVGSVEYSEVRTPKPPFHTSRWLIHRDIDTETIFEVKW